MLCAATRFRLRPLPFLLAATSLFPSSVEGQPNRRPFLFKDSRGELAQARARGEDSVVLAIASVSGRNAAVSAMVERLGGRIGYRADEVDYLRARVPVDRVQEIARHELIHAADISIARRPKSFGLAERSGGPLPFEPADTIWPPLPGAGPLLRRYHPRDDVRASSFLEAHPTYDGRGVTIAMMDMSPDMLLPELQSALSLDGRKIPKIAVFRNALDPEIEDDGRWVSMDADVRAKEGVFELHNASWSAPRDGVFRFGFFDEAMVDTSGVFGSQGLEEDINRDGNPQGASRRFGVLWDFAAGDVWVDTDQDLDFTDEATLGEYDERGVFGVFGTDDPETPVRESVGFGVQLDEDRGRVALNAGIARHATLVVGAAVASLGDAGRFEGMAPGARLASVAEGGSLYGQIEATIVAARRPEVDIIYFEQSSNITRSYLLRDGRLAASVVFDRLTERYGVSILSPTHNFPVLGATDDIVMGRGVIGVGGHESRENFFRNHGVRVEREDNLLITGGYGPMGDGSLKPDVISPSNYVSTSRGWEEGRAMAGLFQLPPGYTIAGGTSTATPTAAGAVALLISGAKQEGRTLSPREIRYAVTRGARWVPHIEAYKQGNGVISVAGAWNVLEQLEAGALEVEIGVQAPVKTSYSHLLPTPHQGLGIYERRGLRKGENVVREITLTRLSGPAGPMTFEVQWDGNDHGAFSSRREVTLGLRRPAPFSVSIGTDSSGVYSAHMTLRHEGVAGYAHRMLAAVAVGEPLNERNNYRWEQELDVPRPGMSSRFVEVPEGVSLLEVRASWEDRPVQLSVVRPDTRAARTRVIQGESGVTRLVDAPAPGVWEIRLADVEDTRSFDWEAARTEEPVPPTPVALEVQALAHRAEFSFDRSGTGWIQLSNEMAEFKGAARATSLASARREVRTIAQGEQHIYEIEAAEGAEALLAQASADSIHDIDLYLFDCTEGECEAYRADGDPDSQERLFVERPARGLWKVVVDAAAVRGEASYAYLDMVLHATHGALSTSDTPQRRAPDARWMVPAHAWVAPGAIAFGRTHWAALQIMGAEGDREYIATLLPLGPVTPLEAPREQEATPASLLGS